MCISPYATTQFFILLLAEFLVSWGLVVVLRRWLLQRKVLDIPNARSSHVTPVPRGGGWAFFSIIVALWLYDWQCSETAYLQLGIIGILSALFVLAVVSWWDDMHDLRFGVRLVIHGTAVGLIFYFAPAHARIWINLPQPLEIAVLFLAAVWFINLFNFMDGINGALAVHAIAIAIGVIVFNHDNYLGKLALFIIPAVAGFLILNWRGKIFAGDIGSVTLGAMLGWLLLQTAYQQNLLIAVILPLYPVTDATLTLLIRLKNGEKFWQPHRDHFYQKAVQSGWSHQRVSLIMLTTNLAMIGCAFIALHQPLTGLAAAVMIVIGVLFYFERRYKCWFVIHAKTL